MRAFLVTLGAMVVAASIGCAQGGAGAHTIELETLNDSGVTGSLRLTPIDANRTQIEINVEPGDNPDMPAHVHPGDCENLVPQPKYPLHNVINGESTTLVPAALEELLAGDLAINLHRSNVDLATYTACAELR